MVGGSAGYGYSIALGGYDCLCLRGGELHLLFHGRIGGQTYCNKVIWIADKVFPQVFNAILFIFHSCHSVVDVE